MLLFDSVLEVDLRRMKMSWKPSLLADKMEFPRINGHLKAFV